MLTVRFDVPELDHDVMMLKRFNSKVSADGIRERRIVWNLCHHLESKGFAIVGVYDGEEFTSTHDAKAAMELIFNLDEASLRIIKKDNDLIFPQDFEQWQKFRDHGILLVMGEGETIIKDWNFFKDDRDGFNAAMDEFDAEKCA